MNRPALSWYVRLVILVGAAAIAQSAVAAFHAPHPREWLLFALLAILTGSFTINVAAIEASISVADTFVIAAALLFGPAPATIALALDTLILSSRKKHDAIRVAFNVAAPACSLWLAAHAFFALAGVPPLSVATESMARLVTPLLCLTAIYFALNSGLIAVAVGLEAQKPPLVVWRKHFMWLSVGYFAAGSLALCLTFVVEQVGLGAIAVILPVVAVFHLTLRASFGRLEDAHRHVTQVDRLYTSTVETLAMAIDAKDDVTHNHVRRVQAYARALAAELGIIDTLTLKAIEAAALLHDTGKLAVPEHILNKPGGLTEAEFEQMKRHVDVGADILSLVDFPYPVVPIVRCHHENWDGSGYPAGVAGVDIPIGARILSVVDCFDALTSDRPYRRRLTPEVALSMLRERSGRFYDPAVVEAFARIHARVEMPPAEAPEHREVLQQISRPRSAESPEPPAESPAAAATPSASGDVLAFVSLARLASGSIGSADILALASSLIAHMVPGATGVWLLLRESEDRLVAADAFGPAGDRLRTLAIRVGDRLSGWVAAHRQVIVNSDAALDLGDVAPPGDVQLKSCLSVPLLAGPTLHGVLSLYATERNAFSEDQGRLVQMIAPHVAQAVAAAAASVAAPALQIKREFKLLARRSV